MVFYCRPYSWNFNGRPSGLRCYRSGKLCTPATRFDMAFFTAYFQLFFTFGSLNILGGSVKEWSFTSFEGPWHAANFHFISPQLDTSQSYETTYMGLVHCVVCPFTPQLPLVLINLPADERMAQCVGKLVRSMPPRDD